MQDIVVVSLFDGMSGGRIALDGVENINVLRYYSSEVDKYAIKVADNNYPQDEEYRLGDITKIDGGKVLASIKDDFGDNVDILLIGGSPCQGFSMAGNINGSVTTDGEEVTTLKRYLELKEARFEFDGQSYLFWEFVRLQKEINPKYFLLENVRVTKKWIEMFNETMGVEPTRINSSLISAQNRDRYYWHNFGDITQPTNKEVSLQNILEPYSGDGNLVDRSVKPGVAKNIREQHDNILKSKKAFYQMSCTSGFQDNKVGLTKTPCLRAGNNATYVFDSSIKAYRKLTPLEWEHLQTIPANYTLVLNEKGKQLVSNTQRYKMIGNGWTIGVVSHILNHINKEI